jgi:hypothetical protein
MATKKWDLALKHFEQNRSVMPKYVDEKIKEIENEKLKN